MEKTPVPAIPFYERDASIDHIIHSSALSSRDKYIFIFCAEKLSKNFYDRVIDACNMKRLLKYCFLNAETRRQCADASTQTGGTPEPFKLNDIFVPDSPHMRKSYSAEALSQLRDCVKKHEISNIHIANKVWMSRMSISSNGVAGEKPSVLTHDDISVKKPLQT